MSRLACLVGCGVLTGLLAESRAQAVEFAYAGSDCSLSANVQSDFNHSLLAYQEPFAYPGMMGPGDPPVIFCPIIGLGTSPTAVSVTAWDLSSVDDIWCTLTTFDQNGTTLYSSQQHTTGYNMVNPYGLYWNSITGGGTYAMLTCTL